MTNSENSFSLEIDEILDSVPLEVFLDKDFIQELKDMFNEKGDLEYE